MNVEERIRNLESYAAAAMKKYGEKVRNDEKIKYAIFEYGLLSSEYIFGYWSRTDREPEEWKLETINYNCEDFDKVKDEKAYRFKNIIDHKYLISTAAYIRNRDRSIIGAEVDSFFYAMKNTFDNDGEYHGKIIIVLPDNSKKSDIFLELMKEKKSMVSNENLNVELIKNIGKIDIDKEKIQIEHRNIVFFKYYLGENRENKFVPFASIGSKLDCEWKPIFELPESELPDAVNLYYTTKAILMDGKHPIDVAKSVMLDIPSLSEGEKVYIKAAGVDRIYCFTAKCETEAEEKLCTEERDPYVALE